MFHRLLAAAGLASNPMPTTPAATGKSPPKPSESAIVAETVVRSHVVAVKGYHRTKGLLDNDEFIRSHIFMDVGGSRWCILYYPDGRGSNNADWISVFLELDRSSASAIVPKVRCTFSLLDEDGEPIPSYSYASDEILWFTCKGATWGCYRFIKRKVLEQSPYLKDDCFRVRCDVTLYKHPQNDDAPGRFVFLPPSNMHRHLERLLKGGEGADVTFEVAGETVAAHRCILAARSPVFMAELFGPMKEKTSARVRIDDMEARVFKALLHFVYTDSLPELEDGNDVAMAQHLLVAADRYSLDRLKLMSEGKLCGSIDTRNVGTILALAEQHDCQGLKKACFRFLMNGSNLKAAMPTTGFEHLAISCPHIVKELLAKAATLISS